jgi:hypothetical protein
MRMARVYPEGAALSEWRLDAPLVHLRELSLARCASLASVNLGAACPALRRLVLDDCPRLATITLAAPSRTLEHVSLARCAPSYGGHQRSHTHAHTRTQRAAKSEFACGRVGGGGGDRVPLAWLAAAEALTELVLDGTIEGARCSQRRLSRTCTCPCVYLSMCVYMCAIVWVGAVGCGCAWARLAGTPLAALDAVPPLLLLSTLRAAACRLERLSAAARWPQLAVLDVSQNALVALDEAAAAGPVPSLRVVAAASNRLRHPARVLRALRSLAPALEALDLRSNPVTQGLADAGRQREAYRAAVARVLPRLATLDGEPVVRSADGASAVKVAAAAAAAPVPPPRASTATLLGALGLGHARMQRQLICMGLNNRVGPAGTVDGRERGRPRRAVAARRLGHGQHDHRNGQCARAHPDSHQRPP